MSAKLTRGINSLHLTIDKPIERVLNGIPEYRNDLSSIKVWCSKNKFFQCDDTTLVFNGLTTNIIITKLASGEAIDNSTKYYLRYTLISDIDSSYIVPIPNINIDPLEISSEAIDINEVSITDINGNVIFGSDGQIGDSAHITIDGSVISISDAFANSLVPSLNFIGTFSTVPTESSLGTSWKQNAVYKNSIDGKSYVLTGEPLTWQVYLEDGKSFTLTIESTNGNTFRPGDAFSTTLIARVFKNGAEITDLLPATSFKWRRVSYYPQDPPNDDSSWNINHLTGYKSIVLNITDVVQRATFYCDIITE